MYRQNVSANADIIIDNIGYVLESLEEFKLIGKRSYLKGVMITDKGKRKIQVLHQQKIDDRKEKTRESKENDRKRKQGKRCESRERDSGFA